MEYLFENLGDERFQEFCQCLISKEFPNTQSFPVGQPDGGRDTLSYTIDSPSKEFIVFQVKFVRNPKQVIDVHKWLLNTIEGEIEKIKKLIPKGATKYYLLTNVNGTAHLDNGSIDKLNALLKENIPIPSHCLWRDDLSRMFEKDSLFKWSFPQILDGQDILNLALFEGLNENKERRQNVVTAYLADQYELDNEVKFRQIDLQNKLLDLFTDVPLRLKKYNSKDKSLKQTLSNLFHGNTVLYTGHEITHIIEHTAVGAAEFLLNTTVQNEIQRILLEGGPGQGKSTISQYISQVHRIRLLNKKEDIELLPVNFRSSPVRLPFKIDLRHIATWVESKNPYQGVLNEEYFSKNWKNSLEAFLVAHIVYHSQVEEFNSNDLISIWKLSPILLVFDGFDEIADLKVRKEVIEFINRGINRLAENSQSIQVLITSRPAAFSDSVGFSVDSFPHFQLIDITPQITNEYVEKWVKASRLDSRESAEIRRLVKDKLEMPHLKDLAKSPMQLAIFISLLRTRGESLPNKRTALYDSYIELFFNRESEKNFLIRDHRDLIIDIHGYLAWVLHSEAELFKNSGIIHIDELKQRLKKYLEEEGHKTDITDNLFDVLNERVCALVSRVQGTFEFEVQPLREYFCAKYLYNTSPYSPVGSEKAGTKPERFEAISRNFYWQNVVRFFAGCFDKGELPMLIQKLRELQTDENLKYTNYPRLLTSQVLSDYVFTQYPLLLKDVVKIIVDGINIGSIINQENKRANEPIALPDECGRKEVARECFNQLSKFPKTDYANELIGIINNNPYNVVLTWKDVATTLNNDYLTQWLEYGYRLGIIHALHENELTQLIETDSNEILKKRLEILIQGNRIEIIENNKKFKELVYKSILNGDFNFIQKKFIGHPFQFLSILSDSTIISDVLESQGHSVAFSDFINRLSRRYVYDARAKEIDLFSFSVSDDLDSKVEEFVSTTKSLFSNDISLFRNSILLWDEIIENGRKIFNDSKVFYTMASQIAGIKSKEEVFEDFEDLNNTSLSLCKRVRCARMKSGNTNYWLKQIENSDNPSFVLLIFLSWGTPKAIISLLTLLDKKITALSNKQFQSLVYELEKGAMNSHFHSTQEESLENALKVFKVSDKLKFILSKRFSPKNSHKFIYNNIQDFSGVLRDVIEVKIDFLINKFLQKPSNMTLLNEIKELYVNSVNVKTDYFYDSYYFGRHQYRNIQSRIPYEISKKIMSDCKNYPRVISSLAEMSCRIHANENSNPVGKVAKEEKWFE